MRKTKEELAKVEFEPFEEEVAAEYNDVFHVYVLAEKLQDKGAQKAALAAAITVSDLVDSGKNWLVPTARDVNFVYRGTPEGSPGRRLVIELYAAKGFKALMYNLRNTKLHQYASYDLAEVLNEVWQKREGCGGNSIAKKGVKEYLAEE